MTKETTQPSVLITNGHGDSWNPDSKDSLLLLWKSVEHTSGGLYGEPNDEGNPNWINLARYEGGWQLNAGFDECPFEPMILNPERFSISFGGMIPESKVREVLAERSRLLVKRKTGQRHSFTGAEIYGAEKEINGIASALNINLSPEGEKQCTHTKTN